MNISLRKASALQDSITTKLHEIALTSRIALGEFDNVPAKLSESRQALFANLELQNNLQEAFYEIRKSLSHANSMHGISDRLAELAKIKKKINMLEEITLAENLQTKENVITGHIEKLKKLAVDQNTYYVNRDLTTGLLVESEILGYKNEISALRKLKVKLNDEILERNIKNEITLSENVVDVLTTNNLI